MNKRHTEFHLKEALEQLQETIASLQKEEFDDTLLQLDMEHLYHHLNTAWNARNATDDETEKCEETDFNKWRKFPTDLEFSE